MTDYGTPGAANTSCSVDPGCQAGYFTCNSGDCVFDMSVCDGTPDCIDGSDEEQCESCLDTCQVAVINCLTLGGDEGACSNEASSCITSCQEDCETLCEAELGTCISSGQSFQSCVAASDQCIADCSALTCTTTQIPTCWGLCSDSSRLGDGFCDADLHCAQLNDDGGDCSLCNGDETPCGDGTCVAAQNVCDGVVHCSTGIDESPETCSTEPTCAPGEFQCGDGLCISEGFVCDGEADCTDLSDEAECGGTDEGGGLSGSTCCDHLLNTGAPGCDTPACAAQVCSSGMDYCCTVTWDATCAMMANDMCPDLCQPTQGETANCCASTSAPGCDNGEPAETHYVEMTLSGGFVPSTLSIQAGDTVVWTNSDFAPHTVTSTTGAGGGFNSDFMPPGASFEKTFLEATTLDYFCQYHTAMVGTVTVSNSCEGCLYAYDPVCFQVMFDETCAAAALTPGICADVCDCN